MAREYDASLGLAVAHGWQIVECREAPRGRNARYIGVRIERDE